MKSIVPWLVSVIFLGEPFRHSRTLLAHRIQADFTILPVLSATRAIALSTMSSIIAMLSILCIAHFNGRLH